MAAYGDYVSPGPKRWERAINGAKNKPNSAHAQLLRDRLETVKGLDTETSEHYWMVEYGFFEKKRHYYCSDFCAGLAMHLEATFEYGMDYQSVAELTDVIRHGYAEVQIGGSAFLCAVEQTDLPRPVKCFACGGKMSKTELKVTDRLNDFKAALKLLETDKSQELADWEKELLEAAEESLAVTPELVSVMVDYDGNILEKKPEIREVSITPREKLLLQYVPQHLRHEVLMRLEQA